MTQIARHPGHWKTLELMTHNYWWPHMSHYIGEYTKTCNSCLQTKVQRQPPIGKLHPLQIPEARWDTLSVDFIMELPEAHGFNAVMNVVDSVSKHAHFIPTNTTITTAGAAHLFLHHVWKLHGIPQVAVWTGGCNLFTNSLMSCTDSLTFASQPLLPITPRWIVKLNESTKNWSSTFTSL